MGVNECIRYGFASALSALSTDGLLIRRWSSNHQPLSQESLRLSSCFDNDVPTQSKTNQHPMLPGVFEVCTRLLYFMLPYSQFPSFWGCLRADHELAFLASRHRGFESGLGEP